MKEELQKLLRQILQPQAGDPPLTETLQQLDQLRSQHSSALGKDLTHYLERRSYQKAWDALATLTP